MYLKIIKYLLIPNFNGYRQILGYFYIHLENFNIFLTFFRELLDIQNCDNKSNNENCKTNPSLLF